MKISKELFIAVRGSFNKEIFELILKGNSIEINSFFFDCKEWAIKNNRELYSSGRGHCYISNLNKNNPDNIFDHYAETEIEAVVKACEYTLKGINEKQLQH